MSDLVARRLGSLSGPYAGWSIVFVSAVGLSFSLGTTLIYTFGIFVKALSSELRTSRGSVALAMSLIDLAVMLTAPFVGRLIDRVGARIVICIAAVCLSFCLVGLSFLRPPLWHLYILYGLAGLTGAATTTIGYSRVVADWFDRRRGLALGLASSGLGIGAAIMPAWAQFIVQHAGWRDAYLGLAIPCLAVTVPVVWFGLRSPQQIQLEPGAFATGATQSGGSSVKNSLRTRNFWMLVIIFSFVAVSVSGASANLVPMLTDAHTSGTTAALAASAFGTAMIVGRIAGGFLLDSFFAPKIAAVLFLGAAAGEATLCAGVGINVALLAAVLLGFVAGAEGDLMPLLVSRYFGMRSMAELYGYILGIFTIGNAAGRYLFAAGFDARHSYNVPLEIGCIALVVSALMSLTLGKYPSSAASGDRSGLGG